MEHTAGLALVTIVPPDADVHASGEFDVATTPSLARQMGDALDAGCVHFRLDLDQVSFCDASTVGVLVTTRRRALAADGTFEIVAASTCVRRILGLVGLDSMLVDAGPTESMVLA